jgi:arginine N-succinyltransferase
LPRYRSGGLGRLLALSRYLYIAANPHRFQKKFFALLRGFIDHNGTSPFWNRVGRHFLPLDYREIERLLIRSETFIPEVIPDHPLYIPLLSRPAQHALGRPHPNALPAKALLLAEGYVAVPEYDIFDGGPRFVANLQDIRTVKKQKEATVSAIHPRKGRPPKYFKHIVGNCKNPFTACYGDVEETGRDVIINDIVAKALQVSPGDLIRYVTVKG